jgi:hypothetical protein
MSEDRKPASQERMWFTRRLVEETGITEAQANQLVDLLGIDWSSLVREARLLNKKR